MKKLLLFLLASSALYSQQIDPRTQINWPRVTGSGSPTSAGFACTSSNIAQPYTDNLGPHYWVCTTGGWFQVDGSSGSIVDFKNGGTLLTGAFGANPQIYDYDDTALTPDSGYTNGKFLKNTTTGKWAVEVPVQTGIDMQPEGLPAGQHALIYPTGFTIVNNNPRTTITANGQTAVNASTIGPAACSQVTWQGAGVCPSVSATIGYQATSFPPAGATATLTFTGALASEAPQINPANITAIYAFTKAGWIGWPSMTAAGVSCGTGTMNVIANTQLTDYNTLISGTSVDTLTCTTGINDSLSSPSPGVLTAGLIGLAVYYTGTAPPADTNLQVAAPLTLLDNILSIDKAFPQTVNGMNVAQLIATTLPNAATNLVFFVNDYNGSTPGTCAGGGTTPAWATSTGGSSFTCTPVVWTGAGSGTVTSVATDNTSGLSGGPITTTGTIACQQSTTTQFGCVKPDGTTITASAGVLTATLAGGGLSGQTINFLPKATSTTASTISSIVEDQGTGIVVHGTSTTHAVFIPPSTGTPTPVATEAGFGADSSGNAVASDNGGAFARVCTATNGVCSTGGTRQWSCQPGLGDGLNNITAGTYAQTTCYNTTGSTITLSGLSCFTDNNGTSTMNATAHTLGALLTGAVTCTSSFAAGTQSANVLLTSGDYIAFTFVADGTTKQTTWVVKGTY